MLDNANDVKQAVYAFFVMVYAMLQKKLRELYIFQLLVVTSLVSFQNEGANMIFIVFLICVYCYIY